MEKNKKVFSKLLKNTKDKLTQLKRKVNTLKTAAKVETLELEPVPKTKSTAQKIVIDVPAAVIARTTLVILGLLVLAYFVFQISSILVMFFVAFLFAAALDPVVDYLSGHKIPRGLSVILIYIFILAIFGLLISSIVPLLVVQITDIASKVNDIVRDLTNPNSQLPFAKDLKPYLDQFYQTIDLKTAATQIQSALSLLATQLLNVSFVLLNLLLVLILTFFMVVEEKSIEDFVLSLFPSRYGMYISTRLEAVKGKVGYWLRGQLLVCLIATVLSYISLLILGVNYALTLSIISGVLMLIPVIGRGFAWVFTFPIVFNQSPALSLWMSIVYFVLQQIENNVFVPYIMNRVVGLSPIILSFAMMVGLQYLGVLGLVISIPIATSVAIFVKDYTEKAK